MNILAIDSSTEVLSAALETKTGSWYSEIDAGIRHSELLMECVDGLCRISGLSPREINAVACAKGPGSFTGLRIGYSAAKGLCMALGIPLIALSTLDCLAYPLSIWPGIVLPAIDAKRGCFFAAFYHGGIRISDYMDADPQTLFKTVEKIAKTPPWPILLTGSGAKMLYSGITSFCTPENVKVHPKFRRGLAKELLEMSKSSIIDNINDINSGPEYIRKSDAELNFGQE